MTSEDEKWMRRALEQAHAAERLGEVPVGAVLVRDGELIAEGFNQPITLNDPTAHAEIVVLRKAAETVSNYRLPDTTLYVTVEPCTMCAGSLIHARIKRLVYGASEPRAGAVASQLQVLSQPFYNHRVDVEGGVLAEECARVMSEFFARKRR
ncbi:tRNA(adenine34) deaminase [Litorivivens lipolytica]|uniref:tRNA-specific adenosine deaminase n=1 Tax=Litorivivens lipolytica TaxID=1524264 RepID=A0A7W4W1W8_9GAMM|nr:tRNA adenosine(34) deaminase TadA [Litorivivens lipolytica]MBB3045876.1 tRNA(adenine34) deaminase [Litorivivens lipolytica]